MDLNKRKRAYHVYTVPRPGDVLPGQERPADWDDEKQGEWTPLTYQGPDPWDSQDPLFHEFAVVGLTGVEEMQAIKEAKGDARALSISCSKRALVEIDGRPVDRGQFEEDTLWAQMPPMVRDLVMDAYSTHNIVQQVTAATFRGSHRVVVK